jgi:outer membrane protein OmpA-like peptidoglycan-associated protein
VEQSISTPVLFLKPSVRSEAGVARWSVDVRRESESYISFSDQGEPPAELEWRIDTTRIPPAGSVVTASLTVEDRAGQVRSTTVSLPFETETRTTEIFEQEGDRRIDRFSLILFDFRSSDLSGDNKRILDIVSEAITPRSRVHIYGFADRTGNPELNRSLAMDRCVSVQRALGSRLDGIDVQLHAIGSDRLLFDNDIPEGRNYCRTVQIVVETGLE